MVTKKEFSNSIKKAKNWDGKSRPTNQVYAKRWSEIFGKDKKNLIIFNKSNVTWMKVTNSLNVISKSVKTMKNI